VRFRKSAGRARHDHGAGAAIAVEDVHGLPRWDKRRPVRAVATFAPAAPRRASLLVGCAVMGKVPCDRRRPDESMKFRTHLIAACSFMLLAIWLSSGTMYPYAATWLVPIVSKSCGYLFNPDHRHYRAAFDMLDGAPRATWEWSIVLRRMFYPLFAFPFMKVAGFVVGGFIASALINVATLIAFASFLRARWGERTAIVGLWLIAINPGVTYWGASPYATATIVPASLALFMLLVRLDERSDLRSVVLNCLAMSVLFTTYDLLPYFSVAAIVLLAYRRRWRAIPVAVACMAIAPAIVLLALAKIAHLPWTNDNTDNYSAMVRAYLHPPAIGVWLRGIAAFPIVLVQVFLFSTIIFLPTAFLLVLIVARQRLTAPEGILFLVIGAVFAFNNLAPPYYETYQMRGPYIPRIYQPVLVVLVVYCARVLGRWETTDRVKRTIAKGALVFALAGNLTIVLGPIARVPWAGEVYQRFYNHAFLETMNENLDRYGRRPLGFCRPMP
jgi:hypothetical protein